MKTAIKTILWAFTTTLTIAMSMTATAGELTPMKDVEAPYIRDREFHDKFNGIRYDGKKAKGYFENLKSVSAGEDESYVELCYEGKEKELCKLVEDIAQKTNEKDDLGPKHFLKVDTCKIDKNDRLDVVVISKAGTRLREENIEKCND